MAMGPLPENKFQYPNEAPRPCLPAGRHRTEPFDKAIRQVDGGESNRTAHSPDHVEGLPGRVHLLQVSLYPTYPASAGRGYSSHQNFFVLEPDSSLVKRYH